MARKYGKDRGLYERPADSGVWWIQYNDADGKKRREKAGTKAQARLLYVKRKGEALQGKKLPELNRREKSWRLKSMIDVHLAEVRTRCKDVESQLRYGKLWADELGDVELDAVVPRVLEAWKTKRSVRAAPATVNNELIFLKRVFNVAIRDGWSGQNPVQRVKFFKLNNQRDRQLESDEEARLRDKLAAPDLRIIELFVHTGLRRGEMFGLRRRDVDLKRRYARIPDPKGGEARVVALNSFAVELFTMQLDGHTSDWVFPSKNPDTPINGDNFYHRVWRKALKDAKIKDLRIHDLRHTFCSRLVTLGKDLYTVQKLAGHKSYQTTQRYAHLSTAHLLEAVEALVPRVAEPPVAPRKRTKAKAASSSKPKFGPMDTQMDTV